MQFEQRGCIFLLPRLAPDFRRVVVLRLTDARFRDLPRALRFAGARFRDLLRDALLRLVGARFRDLLRDLLLRLVEARFRGLRLTIDFRVFERPVFRFRVPLSFPTMAAQSAHSIGFLRRTVLRDRDVLRARVVLRDLELFRLRFGVETDAANFIILLLRTGDSDADRLIPPSSDFIEIISSSIVCSWSSIF